MGRKTGAILGVRTVLAHSLDVTEELRNWG